MDNKDEIFKCIEIIERNSTLLNRLYQMGKEKTLKGTAGKMILRERNNIKVMKARLILLGTNYESASEDYYTRFGRYDWYNKYGIGK